MAANMDYLHEFFMTMNEPFGLLSFYIIYIERRRAKCPQNNEKQQNNQQKQAATIPKLPGNSTVLLQVHKYTLTVQQSMSRTAHYAALTRPLSLR
jgi:hypothetical protein